MLLARHSSKTQHSEGQKISSPIALETRDITIRAEPFRHIVVDDFFTAEFYRSLCQAFAIALANGLSEEFNREKFFRFKGYDAYTRVFPPSLDYPLGFFYSQEWRRFLTNTFSIPATSDTIAEFHHHKIGSMDGFVHNDFNLCSFGDYALENGINPWHYQCQYTDDSLEKQPNTMKRMRSIAVLYYLANPAWQEGDGGETGLFAPDMKTLLAKIAPVNNRLLAFEVSPCSYHGFLTNKTSERNSIVQWLHEEPLTTFSKYPGHQPISWD